MKEQPKKKKVSEWEKQRQRQERGPVLKGTFFFGENLEGILVRELKFKIFWLRGKGGWGAGFDGIVTSGTRV